MPRRLRMLALWVAATVFLYFEAWFGLAAVRSGGLGFPHTLRQGAGVLVMLTIAATALAWVEFDRLVGNPWLGAAARAASVVTFAVVTGGYQVVGFLFASAVDAVVAGKAAMIELATGHGAAARAASVVAFAVVTGGYQVVGFLVASAVDAVVAAKVGMIELVLLYAPFGLVWSYILTLVRPLSWKTRLVWAPAGCFAAWLVLALILELRVV